jgi:hypothetical protein
MDRHAPRRWIGSGWRRLGWVGVLGVLALALMGLGVRYVPERSLGADYVCYWAAGRLLIAGENPYDPALQADIQRDHGWNRDKDGLGIYEFLPFYYPPWFAMLCAALVPLGYSVARMTWILLDAGLVFASAYLLRDAVPGVPRSVPMLLVPLFIFSWTAVIIGQTTPLILFLIVAAWRLMQARHDGLAGAALAWLTIKPQLTVLLLPAVLLWSARQGRWRVVGGFTATLAVLVLASFAVLPGWVRAFLRAPKVTPPPTEYFPWIGSTWFLLLKGVGLRSWGLWGLYLLGAVPFVVAVLRAALDRARPVEDVLSLSLLAAYVVAPYGRHYDFPVLLVPFLVMLGRRLAPAAGAAVLAALLILPYLHFLILPWIKARLRISGKFNPEFTFVWVPLLLAACWLATSVRSRRA